VIATSEPGADLVEVMRTLVSTVTDTSNCVELVCSKARWEALVGARRQARLRREYAPWYPLIGVTAWMPAQSAANAVRRQLVDGEPPWAPKWELGRRVLDERHLLFRGGADRDATQRSAGCSPPPVPTPRDPAQSRPAGRNMKPSAQPAVQ
jgi:hypothetical protein